MPLVRISLDRKFSKETKDIISTSVHQALMQEFNVPHNDYFQIIEELNTSQIKYPESYLGIHHSSEIIFIQIIAALGRSIDQKRRLYKEIAERIERGTEITKNNVFIVLLENVGAENWSFGNGEIQEIKHIKNSFI
ncbi:MAG TPA: tautomerase family protein [Arachidicoccus soli]|nr:tautomerase family protein [Arachidicoccus soli]